MERVTLLIGSALLLMVGGVILRLSYMIIINLMKGRLFHQALEKEFDKQRLSNILLTLGINKNQCLYTTGSVDIKKQIKNCQQCTNTRECDVKLSQAEIAIESIAFCHNADQLREIKQRQTAGESVQA